MVTRTQQFVCRLVVNWKLRQNVEGEEACTHLSDLDNHNRRVLLLVINEAGQFNTR